MKVKTTLIKSLVQSIILQPGSTIYPTEERVTKESSLKSTNKHNIMPQGLPENFVACRQS
jgi:hypothetical protein